MDTNKKIQNKNNFDIVGVSSDSSEFCISWSAEFPHYKIKCIDTFCRKKIAIRDYLSNKQILPHLISFYSCINNTIQMASR
jgi:hypothetical protein